MSFQRFQQPTGFNLPERDFPISTAGGENLTSGGRSQIGDETDMSGDAGPCAPVSLAKIAISPLSNPAASTVPCGANLRAPIRLPLPGKTFVSRHESASRSVIDPSTLPVAMTWPSPLKAILKAGCRVSVIRRMSLRSTTSQSEIDWSRPIVASVLPSGEKARQRIESEVAGEDCDCARISLLVGIHSPDESGQSHARARKQSKPRPEQEKPSATRGAPALPPQALAVKIVPPVWSIHADLTILEPDQGPYCSLIRARAQRTKAKQKA